MDKDFKINSASYDRPFVIKIKKFDLNSIYWTDHLKVVLLYQVLVQSKYIKITELTQASKWLLAAANFLHSKIVVMI